MFDLINSNPLKKLFQCKICTVNYESRMSQTMHVRTKHGIKKNIISHMILVNDDAMTHDLTDPVQILETTSSQISNTSTSENVATLESVAKTLETSPSIVNEAENMKDINSSHNSQKSSHCKKMHQCKICLIRFTCANTLRSHIRKAHEIRVTSSYKIRLDDGSSAVNPTWKETTQTQDASSAPVLNASLQLPTDTESHMPASNNDHSASETNKTDTIDIKAKKSPASAVINTDNSQICEKFFQKKEILLKNFKTIHLNQKKQKWYDKWYDSVSKHIQTRDT
jgi:hypothetical protein